MPSSGFAMTASSHVVVFSCSLAQPFLTWQNMHLFASTYGATLRLGQRNTQVETARSLPKVHVSDHLPTRLTVLVTPTESWDLQNISPKRMSA